MSGRAGGRSLLPLTYVVAAVGTAVVVTFALLTLAIHHRTQQHLLQLQVREAASTLASALPLIQSELDDGLQVARATGSPAAFERFIRARSSSGSRFRSVTLWRRSGSSVQRLALVGAAPALVTDGRERFLSTVTPGTSLQVTPILPDGGSGALGFADMPAADGGLIAYAESSLPPGRRLPVARSNPFGLIQFALYLNDVRPADLLEATGPMPVHSHPARATAQFGNADIVLVGASETNLDGGLAAMLPWIVLGVGLLLTASAAVVAELLGRRRRVAESLADENQRLYLEQRSIATTVQNALLPEVPDLEELDVGARYLAGTAGIDVGGDWYDVVCEPGRCTFVVGDVCGRGLTAATTMAALRFAARAYIAQGDPLEAIVEKLGRLRDLDSGDVFATLVIGDIDIPNRTVTMVSAGHPPPLVVSPGRAEYAELPSNPPVGVAPGRVKAGSLRLPEEGLLLVYTDGLVERRDEGLGLGLDRLRNAALDPSRPVEEVLETVVGTMLPDGAADDTAVLAVRWRGPGEAVSSRS